MNKGKVIAVIGLGYVGLPLAIAFGKNRRVLGFDISESRIEQLKAGIDTTGEAHKVDIDSSSKLFFTSNSQDLKAASIYIVTVPTPIDEHRQPDLTPLKSATKLIAKYLKKNDIVIYESTVYPGCSEEICAPILEAESGLLFNRDFHIGYSPERINPGDKEHNITSIKKIVSGSTPEIAVIIDLLYKEIVVAGTHLVSSIKVAEAAKVIENTQRDINIALINELAMLFSALEIDTEEVLIAAGTKWNFLPFRPGLVGGHCIGVDPYYLTHKAQSIGYTPELILAGRVVNDGMSTYVVNQLIKKLIVDKYNLIAIKVLIMGLTFKENCTDIRNSKVALIYKELKEYGFEVDVFDPWVDRNEAVKEYKINCIDSINQNTYDAIILAVSHDEFRALGPQKIRSYGKYKNIIYDLKYVLASGESDMRL